MQPFRPRLRLHFPAKEDDDDDKRGAAKPERDIKYIRTQQPLEESLAGINLAATVVVVVVKKRIHSFYFLKGKKFTPWNI